jgi:protein-L-isoaspartate(D-aspartate) O-methyltransferase
MKTCRGVLIACVGCGMVLIGATAGLAQGRSAMDNDRSRMVDQAVVGSGIADPRVIEAMRTVPRHEFVPTALRKKAYDDRSLPIGESQTISAPSIVAFMTEQIQPQPGDRVLEIGTGSGYQAAVLSGLVREVYTIEIVVPLGRHAEKVLKQLRYDNVHVKVGDGFQGWPEHAPFDKIIVTCSPESIPQALQTQLKEGGRMVIPVGERYQQNLMILKKVDGKLVTEGMRPTLFVPMTGLAEERRKVQAPPPPPNHKKMPI